MCITVQDVHSCTHAGVIFSISRCPSFCFIESPLETTTGPWLTKADGGVAARRDDTICGVRCNTSHQAVTFINLRTCVASDFGPRADTPPESVLRDESSRDYEEKQKCGQRALTLFRRLEHLCMDCVTKQHSKNEDEVMDSGNGSDSERQKTTEYHVGHNVEQGNESETAASTDDSDGEEEEEEEEEEDDDDDDSEQHVVAPGKSLQDIHLSSDTEHEYASSTGNGDGSDCSDEFLEMKVHKRGGIASCATSSEHHAQVIGMSNSEDGESESDGKSVAEMQRRGNRSSDMEARGGRRVQDRRQIVDRMTSQVHRAEETEKWNMRRIRKVFRGWVRAGKAKRCDVVDGEVTRFEDESRQGRWVTRKAAWE